MSRSEPKMNRRDWFRLRKPIGEAHLQESGSEQDSFRKLLESNPDLGATSTMQPIALPPNHDGMDLAKLPPMREAQLSLDDVLALLNDIENHGTEIQLLQRERSRVPKKEPDDPTIAIELARRGFMNGSIARLQIRYLWQNAFWIDTLETTSNCFRLVRIEHRPL